MFHFQTMVELCEMDFDELVSIFALSHIHYWSKSFPKSISGYDYLLLLNSISVQLLFVLLLFYTLTCKTFVQCVITVTNMHLYFISPPSILGRRGICWTRRKKKKRLYFWRWWEVYRLNLPWPYSLNYFSLLSDLLSLSQDILRHPGGVKELLPLGHFCKIRMCS